MWDDSWMTGDNEAALKSNFGIRAQRRGKHTVHVLTQQNHFYKANKQLSHIVRES